MSGELQSGHTEGLTKRHLGRGCPLHSSNLSSSKFPGTSGFDSKGQTPDAHWGELESGTLDKLLNFFCASVSASIKRELIITPAQRFLCVCENLKQLEQYLALKCELLLPSGK